MSRALIGHTGFVGGNLAAQMPFDACYRASNIETIAGRSFDVVFCAGAPGAKWLANREPDQDQASIVRLTGALASVRAPCCVLLSTVDVFPVPLNVDETNTIPAGEGSAYGRHRRELEQFVMARFERSVIVRLPGLFGPGLKKNAIFDLQHDHQVERIHPEAVFQFYDLTRLAADIDLALAEGLGLVHFATEPVSMRAVAESAFGRPLEHTVAGAAPRYDVRTRHAEVFGGRGPYILDQEQILKRIKAFVNGAPA